MEAHHADATSQRLPRRLDSFACLIRVGIRLQCHVACRLLCIQWSKVKLGQKKIKTKKIRMLSSPLHQIAPDWPSLCCRVELHPHPPIHTYAHMCGVLRTANADAAEYTVRSYLQSGADIKQTHATFVVEPAY